MKNLLDKVLGNRIEINLGSSHVEGIIEYDKENDLYYLSDVDGYITKRFYFNMKHVVYFTVARKEF